MAEREAKRRIEALNENSLAYLLLLQLPAVTQLYAIDCSFRHGGRVLLCPADCTDSQVLPRVGAIFQLEDEFRKLPPAVLTAARRKLGIGVFWPSFREAMAAGPAAVPPVGDDPLRDMAVLAVDALLNIVEPPPAAPAPWYGRLAEFMRQHIYMVGRPADRQPWLAGNDALRAYHHIQRHPDYPVLPLSEYRELVGPAECEKLLDRSKWYQDGVKAVDPAHLLRSERPPLGLTPIQRRRRELDDEILGLDAGLRKREGRFMAAERFNPAEAVEIAGRHAYGKLWSSSGAYNARLVAGHPAGSWAYPVDASGEEIAERIIAFNQNHIDFLRRRAEEEEIDIYLDARNRLMGFVEKIKWLLAGFAAARQGRPPPEPERDVAATVVAEEEVSAGEAAEAAPSPAELLPDPPNPRGLKVLRDRAGMPLVLPEGRSLFEHDAAAFLRDPGLVFKTRKAPRDRCQYCGQSGKPAGSGTHSARLLYVRWDVDELATCNVGRYYLESHHCPVFADAGAATPQYDYDGVVGWRSWCLHISYVADLLNQYRTCLEELHPDVEDKRRVFSGQYGLGSADALRLLMVRLNRDARLRLQAARALGQDPLAAGAPDRQLYQRHHNAGWLAEVLRWGLSELVPDILAPSVPEGEHAQEHTADGGVGGPEVPLPEPVPEIPEIPD